MKPSLCPCGCVERNSFSPIDSHALDGSDIQEFVRPNSIDNNLNYWNKRSIEWIKSFTEVFGEPECGRNRAVFRASNYVYKIPRSEVGAMDNEYENCFRNCHLASSWIVRDADEFPILIMDRVIASQSNVDWTWSIDGGQVGYSIRTGALVAFDYGIH